MDKTVYSSSIVIALMLVAGSYLIPNDAAMWLASTSLVMNLARIAIVGLMLCLIFTDPPRRKELRMLLAVAAGAFAGWAVARTLSGTVQVIDALLFLEAAVSFGLAAIEAEPARQPQTELERVDKYDWQAEVPTFSFPLPKQLVLNLAGLMILYNTSRTNLSDWMEAMVGRPGPVASGHSP